MKTIDNLKKPQKLENALRKRTKKAKEYMRENLIEDFKFFVGILDDAN